MRLTTALYEDEDFQYLRLDSEFCVGTVIFVRHLNRFGTVEGLPTYKNKDYAIRMNDDGSLLFINWFNLFTAEKEKEQAA